MAGFDFCWKVLLAMFNLLFISFSDLPSSVIRASRYVNVWTFSISFPSMCILVLGGLLLLENTIVFVFFAFIRSPKLSLSLLTWSTIFWRSSSVSASNTVSSAHRRLLIFLPPIFTPGSSSICWKTRKRNRKRSFFSF